MSGPRNIVVASPAASPELPWLAAGVARAGALRRYLTSFGSSGNPRLYSLPAQLRQRAELELVKRRLPTELGDSLVAHRARALELAFVTASRTRLPDSLSLSVRSLRNARFDACVARQLRADDTDFVGVANASLTSLRRARTLGVHAVLHYPTVHLDHAERIFAEEARLQPEFADTLRFHGYRRDVRRRYAAEIEAADTIFVLSTFAWRTFVEAGVDPSRVQVLPLGVDAELFRPRDRADDGVFRILYVGQITQRKGISYLLDACAAAAIPRSELVLVGHVVGSDASWRTRPGVRQVPHVPRWLLPDLYATADAVVLPSLLDGFGLTALEAMACARPTIVSEGTFGKDVITDGTDGYVVPIRDADAIAARLVELAADDALRREVGAAARRRAMRLSWTSFGDRAAALLTGPAEREGRAA